MSKTQRLVPWALLAFVVGGSVSWIQRPGDLAGYVTVGNLALVGRHIYRDAPPGLNTWPPFFSLLCVPLALLARPTPYLARGAWLALNFGLLWLTLKMLVDLVHSASLGLRPGAADFSVAAPEVLLPLVLCCRFVLGNFDHLQVNIVIFTCAVAALWWHARGHDACAGAALGVAAALKVMPVLFIPYFLYRRRYGVAAYAAIAGGVLSLCPAAVYGWARFLDYLGAWRESVVAGWGVGKMNQSVFAMLDRFIGHGISPFNCDAVDVLPESGKLAVTMVYVAVLVALAAVALLLFRGPEAPDSPVSLIEYSAVFIASALFGPLAWKAYLVVLLFPLTVLVGLTRRHVLPVAQRRATVTVLGVYFMLTGLTTPGLLGKRLAGRLEMLSVTTIATLLLLLLLLWLRAGVVTPPPRGADG